MKRWRILKLFSSYLNDDDLAIFVGGNICKEAYLYNKPNHFYIEDDTGFGFSVSLGIAMGTNKRVFIFCDDYYFLKDIGSVVQMAVSKCENLFLMVLVSGEYQYSGHNPTIFNEINSVKSLMFGAGFIVNDYTQHFRDTETSKEVKCILQTARGPLFSIIQVGLGENKKALSVELTDVEQLKCLTTFLSTDSTSVYEHPEIEFSFGEEE